MPVNASSAPPKLFVISRPSLTGEIDRFLTSEGTAWKESVKATAAEKLAEFSGRICYMSFGVRQSNRSNAEYVANLIKQGHESVLEHVNWTFLLTGVSRAFTHQLVRHRAGFAYSQLSQQYHDESDASFVQPSGLEKYPEALAKWSQALEVAATAYKSIVSQLQTNIEKSSPGTSDKELQRAVRSAARSVLPNATETKIVVTANARALRHFLIVRGGIVGDSEMRIVSHLIYNMLFQDAPSFVADFSVQMLSDKLPVIVHKHSEGFEL